MHKKEERSALLLGHWPLEQGIRNPFHKMNRCRSSSNGGVSSSKNQPPQNSGDYVNQFFNLDWITDSILLLLAVWLSFGLLTVVALLFVLIRPFSVSAYRRLANRLGMGSFLDAVSLLLPNTRIFLTGDSDVPTPVGASILVSNHVAEADWYSLLMLGNCIGLPGSIKVFLRNEIFHLNKHNNSHQNNGRESSLLLNSNISIHGRADATTDTNTINDDGVYSNISSNTNLTNRRKAPSQDLVLAAKFFHLFLDFPLIDKDDYVSDRESLFKLLRSFTTTAANEASSKTMVTSRDRDNHRNHKKVGGGGGGGGCDGAAVPVNFLLFPEGWSLYDGESRNVVLTRSNGFAKREGRPQLKNLLLPRTTGFNACISSLRESSPVIYDVTIAYRGYRGLQHQKADHLSLLSIWNTLRRLYPEEIHVRIKRYSMEQVLQDASWLDKKWAEKDRILQYFSRHDNFPTDNRGFRRHQVFDTRYHSMETSIASFLRLIALPCVLPVLIFLSIPIVWTTFVAWIMFKGYQYVYEYDNNNHQKKSGNQHHQNRNHRQPHHNHQLSSSSSSSNIHDDHNATPGSSSSNAGTPFIPATPFASPQSSNWQDATY